MKFFESGKLDQVMPSGHMAHSLPRTNFKAGTTPQVKATLPPTAHSQAMNSAIVSQLRSMSNGQTHGLSPAGNPNAGLRGTSKIVSSPGSLPRESGPVSTSQRTRF